MKKLTIYACLLSGVCCLSSPSNATVSIDAFNTEMIDAPQRKGFIAEPRILLGLLRIMGDDTGKVINLIGVSYGHYLLTKSRYFKESRFRIINRPNLENFKRKGIKTRKAAFGNHKYEEVSAEMGRLGLQGHTMEELIAGLAATSRGALLHSAYLFAIVETAQRDRTKIHLIPQEALTASYLYHADLRSLTDLQMRTIPNFVLETLVKCSANDLLREEKRRGRQIFSPEQRRRLHWCIGAQGEKELHWGRFEPDYVLELLGAE